MSHFISWVCMLPAGRNGNDNPKITLLCKRYFYALTVLAFAQPQNLTLVLLMLNKLANTS